jgi:hypothetical protein
MATLESRIKALEGGKGGAEGRGAIFIRGRAPAGHDERMVATVTCGAQVWARHEGETPAELRQRAAREVVPNPAKVALLFERVASA